MSGNKEGNVAIVVTLIFIGYLCDEGNNGLKSV
jgi:hypothetical protein